MQKAMLGIVVTILALALVLVGCSSGQTGSIARGEALAADLGCYGCHGDQGTGGITNPGSPLGTVPGWQTKAFAETFGTADGKPDREKIAFIIEKGPEAYYAEYMTGDEEAQTIARTISEWERQMPAYEDQLTSDQLDDLVDFVVSLNPFFEK